MDQRFQEGSPGDGSREGGVLAVGLVERGSWRWVSRRRGCRTRFCGFYFHAVPVCYFNHVHGSIARFPIFFGGNMVDGLPQLLMPRTSGGKFRNDKK